MNRLFRRIASIGAIVTLIAAGAMSGTYAKTGELRLRWHTPQPSAATLVTSRNHTAQIRPVSVPLRYTPSDEPLRIGRNLPDLRRHDAKDLMANRNSDQGNASSDRQSPLVKLRVIDVEQNQEVSRPGISSSNERDDHAAGTDPSPVILENRVPAVAEPRRIEPNRKTWQLSAAPELVPRDSRLTADKPYLPGSPPVATVKKGTNRPATQEIVRRTTSSALRTQTKPLASSRIEPKHAPTKTLRPPTADSIKDVVQAHPAKRKARITRSTVGRNRDTSTKIARNTPTAVPSGRVPQNKPAEERMQPARRPDASAVTPRLAARAVQTDRFTVDPLVPPQPAKTASTPQTDRAGAQAQRIVSKPRHPLPQISKQRFELVARICSEHIRYGMDLAARGATRSARQEFIEVLNRVSQALDYTAGNHQYSQALNAGLTALREAEDYQTGDTRLSTDVDLKRLVAIHQTAVLKNSGAIEHLTPVTAAQKYLQYAKERLVFASGGQQVASAALYGLACLETLQPNGRPLDKPIRGPRAIALHQAALTVDKGNFASANELGVLLARYGQLDSAADILSHAAKVSPAPEIWHNLASVYELNGAGPQAAHARDMFHRLRADMLNSPTTKHENRQVYWVAPEMFGNQGNSIDADLRQNPIAPQPNKASQSSENASGWSKSRSNKKSGKAGRGPLHHFGRLMREKMASRPDAD